MRKAVVESKFAVGVYRMNLCVNQAEVARHCAEAELLPLRKRRLRIRIGEQFLLYLFKIDFLFRGSRDTRFTEASAALGATVQQGNRAELDEVYVVVFHQVGVKCQRVLHYVCIVWAKWKRSSPNDSGLIVNIALRAIQKFLLHNVLINKRVRKLRAGLQYTLPRSFRQVIEPVRIAQPREA